MCCSHYEIYSYYKIDTPIRRHKTVDETAAQCANELLSSNCTPLQINALIDVHLTKACKNQVACCPGNVNGLLKSPTQTIHLSFQQIVIEMFKSRFTPKAKQSISAPYVISIE